MKKILIIDFKTNKSSNTSWYSYLIYFFQFKDLPPLMFKVIPHRIDLLPGESKEILIEGFSEKAQLIEEVFACQAIIGKSSGKDRIMKFKIRCEFIEPLVSFSKKELKFRCERVNKTPKQEWTAKLMY